MPPKRSLAEVEGEIAQLNQTISEARNRIKLLQQEEDDHPDTQERDAQELANLIAVLKKRLEQKGFLNVDTVLDRIHSGLSTCPRYAEYPVRLETKYYMPDAEGTATVVVYGWREGGNVFFGHVTFHNLWSGRNSELACSFARDHWTFGEMTNKMPESMKQYLPAKSADELDEAIFYDVGVDEERDLTKVITEVTRTSLLSVFSLIADTSDVEEILDSIKELLPEWKRKDTTSSTSEEDEEDDEDAE